ncbi:YeeE/YedE family protein [Myroides sp. 1354]|uniref:YeeE/YedE family protein n=1 Tax=unclassified Myroides TaxID=2642485 RepID=UPI002577681E|nr:MULTISPECIES: YeeE/YedE thiosulfate transporter family protein [unclassified Myroides]MDM1044048.1 YeeE/YedE family protein [Myroides sp. R163-1]MDM1054983.1 YeeE/YedE family protein [Myroides sp. 1354]MDM1068280.1 YeeE/YedE family protein [Myroides sp. 1372]
MHWIYEPWPWYMGGIFIATTLVLLLLMGKTFGFSSNLRTMCSMMGAGKTCDFFCFNWKAQTWNLLFLIGTILGGFIAYHFLSVNGAAIPLGESTIQKLNELGIESAGQAYVPTELFGEEAFSSIKTILLLLIAGFFVGFGSRYAGGCTSGHAITGLSNFQLPSLIAVIGFFIGGLIMVHLIFPLIF